MRELPKLLTLQGEQISTVGGYRLNRATRFALQPSELTRLVRPDALVQEPKHLKKQKKKNNKKKINKKMYNDEPFPVSPRP